MSTRIARCYEVTLRFKTKEERDFFMGQLTDGFGENEAVVRRINSTLYTVDPTINESWEHYCKREERKQSRK